MPGVPLITAGGPDAAAREEGEATGAPGNEADAAEDTTAPTTEGERADGASGPAAKVECTEAAEETVPPAPASVGAAPEVESTPAPDEAVAVAATTEEDAGADASEAAHAAELEAALLAVSSPGREGPAEPTADAAVVPVETPDAAAEPVETPSSPKELRSEVHWLDLLNGRSASFWSRDFCKKILCKISLRRFLRWYLRREPKVRAVRLCP
jgi:hypothetical protein